MTEFYIVCWGDMYYPRGGLDDKHKVFRDKVDAEAYADAKAEESLCWSSVHVLKFNGEELEIE